MQIQVRPLREALELLKPVVPKKPTLTVIKNLLLDDGHLRATDLEVMVDIKIAPPNGERFLLPNLELIDLLKRIDGRATLTLTREGRMLHIEWEDGKASFDVESKPEDYPPSARIEPTIMGTIDGSRLISALAAVAEYAATESSRPILNGVEIALGEKIKVGAADGFRLAFLELPISIMPYRDPEGTTSSAITGVVLPLHAVTVLDFLNHKAPRAAPRNGTIGDLITARRMIELVMSKSALRLGFGDIVFTSILVQGTFPNYMQLIPQETPIRVSFMAPDLQRALKAIKSKDTAVKLVWTTDKLTVATSGIELRIPATSETPGRCALSSKFLLGYLSGKSSVVEMRKADNGGPIVFVHNSAPFVMIMPMVWPDEPEKKETPAPVNEAETEEDEDMINATGELEDSHNEEDETEPYQDETGDPEDETEPYQDETGDPDVEPVAVVDSNEFDASSMTAPTEE